MKNLIRRGNILLTRNLVRGKSVYGEKLVEINGEEYRLWDPRESKLAAAIILGFKLDINEDSKVLYLGASSGSSLSHLSDIAVNGKIYGVEISKEMIARLIALAEERENIFPIFADARYPEEYQNLVKDAEWTYQDIPQRDQIDIFVRNLKITSGKRGLIVVKSRSIAVNKKVEEIYKTVLKQLSQYVIIERAKILSPYYGDHIAISCRLKE